MEDECKAYKPWIRTENYDGTLQAACRVCPHFGNCEWTGPEDVEKHVESE
jgi:hypothetical protein